MTDRDHPDASRHPQAQLPPREEDEAGLWRHLEDDQPREEPRDDDGAPTPQLTQSQVKRLTTPMIGMIITMGVLSLVLAGLWMLNPEPDITYSRDEDVAEAADWAASVTEYAPIAPQVPDEWSANYARWETRAEHGVDVWEVGYTTEAVSFVGFAQTDEPNPAWVNEETRQARVTGTATVEGFTFETREEGDRLYYVLDGEDNTVDGTTIIIGGDAGTEEFETAVEAIVEAIGVEVSE
ncbi:DUF4245 domain-containing protein [Nesterenkonia flava]|uniref:DUF4245 domain-containing protein n=1 Tax=Nesterenkonia flava TaxID=469799 RepID=A0ABU1FQ74_9MICC|nr:DUF4245 domain-containing protein [Nesterenkonia flava]MDR5710800.1 DUF4245 domain-containing protein [Nesterenkonia flava]